MRKQSLRRFICVFAIAAIFLLSGCVRLEVHEQFYPNGRSRVVSQIYVQNLAQTLQDAKIPPPARYSNSSGWEKYIEDECASFSSKTYGANCHRSGEWLIIDDSRISGPDYVITSYDSFPYTIYELTIYRPPVPKIPGFEEIAGVKIPSNSTFSSLSDLELSQIRASGLKFNYLITVPGEIVEHNAGNATGSDLSLDAVEVAQSQKPIEIKSRLLNLSQVATIAVGGLFLFLTIDFAAIWALREWSARKEISDKLRATREAEDAKKRVFRKDSRLKGNQVYISPEENSNQ